MPGVSLLTTIKSDNVLFLSQDFLFVLIRLMTPKSLSFAEEVAGIDNIKSITLSTLSTVPSGLRALFISCYLVFCISLPYLLYNMLFSVSHSSSISSLGNINCSL